MRILWIRRRRGLRVLAPVAVICAGQASPMKLLNRVMGCGRSKLASAKQGALSTDNGHDGYSEKKKVDKRK